MKRTIFALGLTLALFVGLDSASAQEGRRPALPEGEQAGNPGAGDRGGGFRRPGGPGGFGRFGRAEGQRPDESRPFGPRFGAQQGEGQGGRFGARQGAGPGGRFGGPQGGGPGGRFRAGQGEGQGGRFGAQPGGGPRGRFGAQQGGGPGGRFGLGGRRHLRQRVHEFVRSLEITPEQRDQARDVVRSLRPLVDEVRPQARALVEQARELARSNRRDEARELLRTQLKPLLQGAAERAKPAVRPLVQTLTPEQRARLEAAAAARGREFDEERFTTWLTRRLARRAAH